MLEVALLKVCCSAAFPCRFGLSGKRFGGAQCRFATQSEGGVGGVERCLPRTDCLQPMADAVLAVVERGDQVRQQTAAEQRKDRLSN